MIWKAIVQAVYENEIQASCFSTSNGLFLRIVTTLHIALSWLPFPIGQVRF